MQITTEETVCSLMTENPAYAFSLFPTLCYAVLPAEPKLEAEILMSGAKTVCERCGVPIVKHSNRQKYCAECARIMYLKNKAKYQRNKRSGVDN
mgnify:CR=1 FL=1